MSPVPYGMVPGQRHELPGITIPDATPAPDEINLDESPPAPYGMEPGKRHFLPGITPLLQQSSPIGGAPPPAPQEDESQYRDENGHELGISFMLDGKRVNLKPNLEASHEHRGRQINDLGQALMKHAHTDAEKQAAERAAAWGLAQADTDIPLEHVMKSMDESYRKDTGYEQALARQLLVNQGKMNAVRAAHPFGLGGGTSLKQVKFDTQEEDKANDDVQHVIELERKGSNYSQLEQRNEAYLQALNGLRNGNGAQQRFAIQQLVAAMSGKTVSDRERQIYMGLNGKLSEWENSARGLFPDPSLDDGYRAEIAAMLQAGLQEMDRQREKYAEQAVKRLESSGYLDRYSPEKRAARVAGVRSALGGKDISAEDAPKPAPQPQKKGYNINDFVGH